MGSLREFLIEQAERLRAEPSKAAAARDEWVEAVDRLIAQVREWLAEADTNHVLEVQERTVAIREEMIGSYEAPALTIFLGVRSVRVEPIGRYVMGPLASGGAVHVPRAFGRVDLTNGLEKYLIYRKAIEPTDRWLIVKQEGYRVSEFDRDSFEAAFQGLVE